MASVIQSTTVADSYSGSFGSNVTPGNTVFVTVHGFSSSNVVISSSAVTLGGSAAGFAKIMEVQSGFSSGTLYLGIWMGRNSAGAASAVVATVANSTLTADNGLTLIEVAGLGPCPVLDGQNSASATTGTAVSSGASSPSTVTGSEFALGAANAINSLSTLPASPWANLNIGGGSDAVSGNQIVSAAGSSLTYSGTGASSGVWVAAVMTFTPSPVPLPTLRLLAARPPGTAGAAAGRTGAQHSR